METNPKRKVLVPEYLTKFKCIGPECEDTCCAGFSHIDIDITTYQKYKRIKGKPLKEIIKKHVTVNLENKKDPTNFAKINVSSKGICPFLTEGKLCKIQTEKGEEYLSDLCGSYPRVSNEINGKLEKSAAMSCPEAVRLVLLNPEGIKFIETEETAPYQNLYKAIIHTDEAPFFGTPIQFINELRNCSIDILKDRRYLVWERLILLGHFIQKAEGNTEKINGLISEFQVYRNNTEVIKKDLSELSTSSRVQFVILTYIIGKKILSGFEHPRYYECFKEFLSGLNYDSSKDMGNLIRDYEDSYQKYYLPYMSEHEYILENYLVNYVFRNVFPALTKKSIFDEYIILVIHYSLIKMHLIGMSGHHKQLTDELVVKLIQSLAKTFEHSHKYIKDMFQFLKDNKLNTFNHMVILIKN